MAEPRGGTVSELSLVVDTSAGACAPTVGASVRLMSGEMAGAFRATVRAEGLASGSACCAANRLTATDGMRTFTDVQRGQQDVQGAARHQDAFAGNACGTCLGTCCMLYRVMCRVPSEQTLGLQHVTFA